MKTKQSLKRVLCCLLAFVMVFSLVACGGTSQEQPTQAEQSPTNGEATVSTTADPHAEKVTLTWLMKGDNNVAENTEVEQYIEELFNVELEITYVSKDDYKTKLNTLIAAGTLPDIFSTSGQTALDLRDAGMLADMAPYLEQYGADILAAYEEGELQNPQINVDGKVYGLAKKSGLYVGNLHIRKDWLENVGMEVPTNLDELYDMLYAFTYNDPDQDGKNNTYGFTAQMDTPKTWEHIFAAYGIPYDKNITLEDGTVSRYVKHPNYLRAIEYFRTLYQNGIMDPDFVATTWVEYAEKLWNNEIGVFGFQSVGPANNWFPSRYTFETPENAEDLFTFAHLEHVDTGELTGGVKPYASTTSLDAVISSECENIDRAVEILNWMFYSEEGQNTTYLGIEGVMYEWTDKEAGAYTRLGDYVDDAVHRAAGAYVYNTAGGWTLSNAETRGMNALTQTSQAEEMAIATDHTFIADTLDTWSANGDAIEAVELEMLVALITTTGDVEAEYAKFIEQWEAVGGAAWEEEATEYMQNK